ncbi:MAG: hypothetical protein J1E40_12730 [Oscillospiraceae bacterium]|nr:hypothetical protein [Oscillospiraceae bacterium]
MEKFKKQIRAKMIFYIGFAVLMGVTYTVIYFILDDKLTFAAGYSFGFCFGVIAAAVVLAIRCGLAFKDPERLKKLYIAETDERNRLIREKTTSGSFTLSALIFGFAASVAAFFSETVTSVLAAVILVMAAVKMSLKFYYDRKY